MLIKKFASTSWHMW